MQRKKHAKFQQRKTTQTPSRRSKPFGRLMGRALMGGGLAISGGLAGLENSVDAAIIHSIPEASFDGPNLAGSGNYSYIFSLANYPWIETGSNPNSWLYNTAYASDELSPFSAPNAVHLADGNIFQVIGDSFVAGRTYTLKARVGNQVNQADENGFGMRLFDGASGQFSGATVFASQNYALGADYFNDGVWREVTLNYTATAAANGKPIGIYLGPEAPANNISVDNASLTSIPEPGALGLMGAGGVLLWQLRRRGRKS